MRYFIFCFFHGFRRCFVAFAEAVAVAWGLLAVGCAYVEDVEGDENLHLTFLNVGQGLSVLLEASGRYALFDTGPDSTGFVDTLRARGIDTLEWVVLSHNHRDHAGGFMEIGAGVKTATPRVHVRRLFVGPDISGGFIRDSVLRLAERFHIPVDTLVRGNVLELAGAPTSLRMDVLWPPERLRVGENAASVVLQIFNRSCDVLLTADLDSAGERRLLEQSPSLRSDLLQVAHHGSSGSNTMEFLSKMSPRYAVVSVGRHNVYGHPAASVMRKLLYVIGDSTSVFRTDLDGSVNFECVEGVGLISNAP